MFCCFHFQFIYLVTNKLWNIRYSCAVLSAASHISLVFGLSLSTRQSKAMCFLNCHRKSWRLIDAIELSHTYQLCACDQLTVNGAKEKWKKKNTHKHKRLSKCRFVRTTEWFSLKKLFTASECDLIASVCHSVNRL